MLSLVSDQQDKSAPFSIMSSKLQNWLDVNRFNPYSWPIVVIPCIYWAVCVAYLLVFWFDILHAIAKYNRTSHCIAANSEHFEVSIVSIVMILWAIGFTSFAFHIIWLFLSWIIYECCSHNYASPWANQWENRTDDPRHNSNRDSPFD